MCKAALFARRTRLPNAFIEKTELPTEPELSAALGGAKAVWDRLLQELATEQGVTESEWKSYSPKHGWALRVTRKKRTIIWLSPAKKCFHVLFILGEKAMNLAREERWPKAGVRALAESVKYPEGTAVRFVIKPAGEIEMLKKLAAIKAASFV